MKIQQVDSKNITRFIISDTTASFVNALRRACTFEVPVLAMEDVYIVKNSSALYDEILSHRLGLIPLKTDLKTYGLKEKCTCKNEGCAKCQVKLVIKIAGPCMVRAKDIKSNDPSVKPIFPEMPIVELLERQEVELEAIAILGQGKEHAKWGAGHSFYQSYPTIVVGSSKNIKQGIDHCPKDVFKDNKVANILNCNLCLACQEYSDKAITVSEEKGKFIFTLEPWGQLSAKDIFKESVTIFKQKIKELKI